MLVFEKQENDVTINEIMQQYTEGEHKCGDNYILVKQPIKNSIEE